MDNQELEDIIKKADNIVSNPTTGTAHNRNENELQGYVIKTNIHLIKTIKRLDEQNVKLEKRNNDLQTQMLYLTYATGMLAVITFVTQILIPAIRLIFKI